MKWCRTSIVMLAGFFALASPPAQADVFNMGPGLTSLEMVPVGDPGNAGDTRYSPPRSCGAVGYNYQIGKYEVTAAQYTEFLNAVAATDTYGLYQAEMWTDPYGCKIERTWMGSEGWSYSVAADRANRPVNMISFWDGARFCNWLHNGQGSGDTETGAYTLNGYTGDAGGDISRNAGARWWIPSEDEWYKAVYYKGGRDAGYWTYPTQNDVEPSNELIDPTDPGNNANFYDGTFTIGSPYWMTEVGDFENSESAYNTFDQGGNVWEWNDTVFGY